MRKNDYIIPLVLFAVTILIVLCGWGIYYLLDRDAQALLRHVEKIEDMVELGDWPGAEQYLLDTNKTWKSISAYWPMLVHHEEMDRIEESMNKLKSYLRHEDIIQTLAELYNLKYFIKHIPQKEAFNLQNIF